MNTSSSIHVSHGSRAEPSASAPDESHDLNARAEHRATLALFAGIVVLATVGVLLSVIANSIMGSRHHPATMGLGAGLATSGGTASATGSASAGAAQPISLAVVPGGKLGPKGERYDAFTKTNLAVEVGQPVRLTIDNRDDVVHSITSTAAGVNIVVMPGKHTYALVVHQTGRFKWVCAYPCDPYSMDTPGYMQGYITAT